MVMLLLGTSLGNSGKAALLETSGSRLAGILSLARQQAISRNAISAVVLSTDSSAKGGLRALTVYEIVPRANGAEPSSADWKQVHPWEVLPDGVLIDGSTFESASNAPYPPLPEIHFRGQKVDLYRYLLFSPDGSLLQGEPARIRVAEGLLPDGAVNPVYTRPGDGGQPANVYEISVLITGLTKIDRP